MYFRRQSLSTVCTPSQGPVDHFVDRIERDDPRIEHEGMNIRVGRRGIVWAVIGIKAWYGTRQNALGDVHSGADFHKHCQG
jgi:hypothetical protein